MHAWAGNALDGANYDFLNALIRSAATAQRRPPIAQASQK